MTCLMSSFFMFEEYFHSCKWLIKFHPTKILYCDRGCEYDFPGWV